MDRLTTKGVVVEQECKSHIRMLIAQWENVIFTNDLIQMYSTAISSLLIHVYMDRIFEMVKELQ